MKIIGIKKLDFTTKEGDVIKGQQLVLTGPIEPNKGEGEEAEKIFLSAEKLSKMLFKPKLYDEVTVVYNKYGKCDHIEKVK